MCYKSISFTNVKVWQTASFSVSDSSHMRLSNLNDKSIWQKNVKNKDKMAHHVVKI